MPTYAVDLVSLVAGVVLGILLVFAIVGAMQWGSR
jgi:hypothetical protein